MTIPSTPSWWDAKFKDLPLVTVPSYEYPTHDGDMAQLDELADRVLCYPAREVATLPHRYIWHQTQDATGIYPTQIIRAMRRACGDE